MDTKTTQRMREHIKTSEGVREQAYKDTKGKITVGVGFLVDDEKSFASIPFQVRDPVTKETRPATKEEKQAEFRRMKSSSDPNVTSSMKMPRDEMERKLDTEIATRVDKVKKEIGEADWNRLTDGQKTAVVDIHYANGSLEKFAKLKEAIKTGDAKAMAEQSDFHGGKMKDSEYLHRNFDRLRRNRAEMQGIDPESPEAYRAVADKYRGHPSLKDEYKKHASPPGTVPQPAKPSQQPQASGQQPQTSGNGYTIQAGDSLSKIAARHGISQEELAKANGITDPNHIRAGKTLKIPGQDGGGDAPGPASPPATPATPPAPAPSPNPTPQLQAPTPEPRPESATAPEQNAPEPPSDPRAAQLVEMASSPVDNPGRSALLKPVESLTESEMKDMIASAQTDYRGWRSGDPLKAHTYERVQDWHVNVYGDGPQANDGGKPIEPVPLRPIPEQPSPHSTPQGEDLWQATARIGQKVADAGAIDGFDDAVKGLQRGLNILGEANPLPARSPAYGPYTKLGPVTEDGKYGPQTDFALKHATARLGPAKVDEAFALGRFNTFARNAQKSGNSDGLEDRTHSIFGPLFRKDDSGPKIEGGVLQETLNGIGSSRRDDWTPLKVDNWIGPKTTEAFGKVLKDEDADGITSAFGKGLGLL